MTSSELSALRDVGAAAAVAAPAAAGSVTTVLTDGATTVISAGASLAEKVADKAVDISGDEVALRLHTADPTSDPTDPTDQEA
ncbi:MAG: hypothetical protein ABIZ07_08165 [Dermatophilaceae bacterium]